MQTAGAAVAEAELLLHAQRYLDQRERGEHQRSDLEAAWVQFHDFYSRKIRKFAFACGLTEEDVAECVQEVWAELLVRLPGFQFDPSRGSFDTWLFQIVRSKTIDKQRTQRRRFLQESDLSLQCVMDSHPSPERILEDEETFAIAWDELRNRLSDFNFQVLRLRLIERQPVAEVASALGLSHEQVWYRVHRARRELEEIVSGMACGRLVQHSNGNSFHERTEKPPESAQAAAPSSVSRNAEFSSLGRHGGSCVDYVFQRLELGRRELMPEWKVEWNCDPLPKPVLYIRKLSMVAYAELCGCEDFINIHWPRIVNAAIAAGVAAGVATIMATPTAAVPIFQSEFYKRLQGKGDCAAEEKIRVSLSARQEGNGPWCVCKD